MDDDLREELEAEAKLEDRPSSHLANRASRSMLRTKAARRQAIDVALSEAEAGAFISQEAMNAMAENFRGPETTMRIAHLSSITCPTLLTWGRDDRVSPIDMALVPMRLIPNCELHTFPNCGHWAQIERKAEFESVTRAFLLRED